MYAQIHISIAKTQKINILLQELMTRQIPYAHIASRFEIRVYLEITRGVLPIIPEVSSDLSSVERGLWELCRKCWKSNVNDRPGLGTVVSSLDELLGNLPLPPDPAQNTAVDRYMDQEILPIILFLPRRRLRIRLNTLLSVDPRHPDLPFILWDLRNHDGRAIVANTGRIISSSDEVRLLHATSPPAQAFRITCDLFPTRSWDINVSNPRGVKVGDILIGLYQGLQRQMKRSEWVRVRREDQDRVAEAFYDRHGRRLLSNHLCSGVRRIDWLLKRSLFVGFLPSDNDPYTWVLITRRIFADRSTI